MKSLVCKFQCNLMILEERHIELQERFRCFTCPPDRRDSGVCGRWSGLYSQEGKQGGLGAQKWCP